MILIPYVAAVLRFFRWAVTIFAGLSIVAISVGLLFGLLFGAMVTGCNATLETVNGRALIKRVR